MVRVDRAAGGGANGGDFIGFLDQVFSQSALGVCCLNTGRVVRWANEVFGRQVGLPVGQIAGLTLEKVAPVWASQAGEICDRVRDTGEVWHADAHPYVTPERPERGTTYWNASVIPLYDPPGDFAGWLLVNNDVTGQVQESAKVERERSDARRVVETLARERDVIQAIMENTSTCLAYLDPDFNFVRVNAAYSQLSGHSKEELFGRNHFDLFPNAENQAIFERARDTGQPVEFKAKPFEFADQPWRGTTYWDWTLTPVKDAQERVHGLAFSLLDVTEKVRAAERQRFLVEAGTVLNAFLSPEATFQSLAHLLVPILADWCAVELVEDDLSVRCVGVAHADPAKEDAIWRVKAVAQAGLQFPKRLLAALRAGRAYTITEVSDEFLAGLASDEEHLQLIRSLDPRGFMIVPLVARGHTLGVISLVSSESGRRYGDEDLALAEEVARRAAIAIDNARLYEAEQKARARAEEAVRVRDEFLSVASHELKTPLTSLLGYTQMLSRRIDKEGIADAGRVRQVLRVIDQQATKLARLVNQLLEVSRIEAGRLALECQMVDLMALAEDVATRAQAETSQHTIVVSGPAEVQAFIDALRVEQVVANLIDNAVKYSPDGGPVEVELRQPDARTVQISVTDCGVGVPVEHRERIFDRFYQGQRRFPVGGMGLGLFICRQIAELHGGSIDAEFPAKGGARFVVTLPAGTNGPSRPEP